MIRRYPHNNGVCYDMTVIPVSVAFWAGGLAGQAHYVVSHVLKQWPRRLVDHYYAIAGNGQQHASGTARATSTAFVNNKESPEAQPRGLQPFVDSCARVGVDVWIAFKC